MWTCGGAREHLQTGSWIFADENSGMPGHACLADRCCRNRRLGGPWGPLEPSSCQQRGERIQRRERRRQMKLTGRGEQSGLQVPLGASGLAACLTQAPVYGTYPAPRYQPKSLAVCRLACLFSAGGPTPSPKYHSTDFWLANTSHFIPFQLPWINIHQSQPTRRRLQQCRADHETGDLEGLRLRDNRQFPVSWVYCRERL